VCRQKGMPSVPTVLRWASQKPEFAEQYRLACQVRETNWFEELREIADDSEGDYIQVDGRRVFNGENVQRSRLKIETTRWMLAKMSPRGSSPTGRRLRSSATYPSPSTSRQKRFETRSGGRMRFPRSWRMRA
jgi:terminase small subunit-like protein